MKRGPQNVWRMRMKIKRDPRNVSDPRESHTRSSDYLKKPSMNQHDQQISATTPQRAQLTTQQISVTTELDFPQSGSENDDEAWLTELTGSKITTPTEVVAESDPQAKACLELCGAVSSTSEDSVWTRTRTASNTRPNNFRPC